MMKARMCVHPNRKTIHNLTFVSYSVCEFHCERLRVKWPKVILSPSLASAQLVCFVVFVTVFTQFTMFSLNINLKE